MNARIVDQRSNSAEKMILEHISMGSKLYVVRCVMIKFPPGKFLGM